MDEKKIVDLNSLKILEDDSKIISVDKLIAKTVLTLNKAGYKTLASCSGHYCYPKMTLQYNVDLEFLEEVQNDPLAFAAEIRDDNFDCWSADRITTIYIMFDKKYNFPNLPEGFNQKENGTLRHIIEFFDNNSKRKSSEDITKEIEKYNKILEIWASKLPVRKDDK